MLKNDFISFGIWHTKFQHLLRNNKSCLMGVFSNIYIDSVSSGELHGLFSVKSVLSLELSRQELGANIECRVETPALENVVSNHIHIDLQGIIKTKQTFKLLNLFIL